MEVKGRKILIIEDNIKTMMELKTYFSTENEVTVSITKEDAAEQLLKNQYDVIILDIILPDGSGLDLLNIKSPMPPTIILTDLNSDDNIIDGLHLGACDYVIKPCSPRVLDAKISLRLLPPHKAQIETRGLKINSIHRTVHYNDKLIQLTSSEFNILYFLMTHANNFYSSNKLYEEIWHEQSLNTTTIRKHISSMRRKLVEAAPNINFILTDFGKGYAFAEE